MPLRASCAKWQPTDVEFPDVFADPGALDSFLALQFGFEVVHLRGHAGRFAELRTAPNEDRFLRSVERTLEAVVRVVPPGENGHDGTRDRLIFHTGGPAFPCVVRNQEALAWEGTLEDGDILCIPSGHQSDETPAPHLVLELMRPSAVDLLTWVARAARSRPEFQEAAPMFATLCVQAKYLEDVRRAVSEFLSAPALLDVFRRRMNGQAPARVIAGETPSLAASTASDSDIAELTAPRRLHYLSRGATFSIHTNGKHLEFPNEALPVLLALEQRDPMAMGELRQDFATEIERGDLDDLLDVLASNAVIRIRTSGLV